jgi:hypothetical protein
MRSFTAGNGSDSTAAVKTYLSSHRQLHLTDLYVISTAPNYQSFYLGQTFYLTNYPSSLVWTFRGTFKTAVIDRGEVESKIGLEADQLEVTWAPRDTDILATDGIGNTLLTALGGFGSGVFDNGTLEVWRCVMPTIGDCNTLGACLMFSGRIGNIEPDRLKVKITVVSRLEVLNQMVPTNLIEPTNIIAQYTTGQVLKNGPSTFTLVSGTTSSVLVADPVAPPGGYSPQNDTWDSGYVSMLAPGKTGGSFRGIQQQLYNGTHHVFYLYDPLPFAPLAGDTFSAFIPVPRDLQGATTQSSDYAGFPYVPQPINSTVGLT